MPSFVCNGRAAAEIYSLSLHDALPICSVDFHGHGWSAGGIRLRAHRGSVARDARAGDCERRGGGGGAFRAPGDGRMRGCGAGGVDFPLRDIHRESVEGRTGQARHRGAGGGVIIPCIDLMAGKVVQLVQGREKALEGGTVAEMLRKFAAFPEIQAIDLDAAMGRGSNGELIRQVAAGATARVGGGVRTVERARALMEQGAHRVIVGTAAFGKTGVNAGFLHALRDGVGRERVVVALDSKGGRIVVKGWGESSELAPGEVPALVE